MKATLQFNLPEEREEHYLAIHGAAYSCLVTDIFDLLRKKLKYEELDEKTYEIISNLRDELGKLYEESGLE